MLTIGLPAVGTFDVIEVYAAISNDRSGAVLVDSVGGSVYRHNLSGGVTRYYWVRSRRGRSTSDWYPTSATGGVAAATFSRFIARGNCQILGNVGRKVGGSTAFDSDIYSPDQYSNGCFVSWRNDFTNKDTIVGLNRDPSTDQNFTGIDYCINSNSAGLAYVYESGVQVQALGAYTTSTVFTITYDGKLIKYFMGGALVRQVPVGNLTLFMDSSFYHDGSQISALQFGPLTGITPSPWVARGNCIAGLTTARKSGGTAAWDSDVYSIDSYPICHIKFKPSQTNAYLMVGLNADPITDQIYASIDFAWYPQSGGSLSIYESGNLIGAYGTYTEQTELAITYDGANVRYYKDRQLMRTFAISSAVFYADSSFYDPGGAVNSLHFGPGTALEAVGTPGIEPYAATDTYFASDAGPDTFVAGTHPGSPDFYLRIDGAGVPADSTVRATLTSDMVVATGGTLGQINMIMDWGAGNQSADILECADTIRQNFSTVREFTALPDSTPWTLTVRTGGSASASTTYTNTRVHVEVIKR